MEYDDYSLCIISVWAGPSTKTTQVLLRCCGECRFELYSSTCLSHFCMFHDAEGIVQLYSDRHRSPFFAISSLSALQVLMLIVVSGLVAGVSTLRRTISQNSKARLTRILLPLRTTFHQRKKHFYTDHRVTSMAWYMGDTSTSQFAGFGVVLAVGLFSLFAVQLCGDVGVVLHASKCRNGRSSIN